MYLAAPKRLLSRGYMSINVVTGKIGKFQEICSLDITRGIGKRATEPVKLWSMLQLQQSYIMLRIKISIFPSKFSNLNFDI